MRLRAGIAAVSLIAAGWGVAFIVANRPGQPPTTPTLLIAPIVQPAGDRVTYPRTRNVALALPDGSERRIYSVLNVRRPMRFGDYIWNDKDIAAGPAWVRVDLARQTLSVFRAGHEIGTAVILFGTDGKPTPAGLFPVLAKAKQHRSTLYDAEMPFMLRLTGDGVAIHASNVRQGSATHGCIGVPMAFARLLYDQIKVGDPVAIVAT